MFDANHGGVFDSELVDAVGRLTDAARTFFGFYDGGTIADPMMLDETWRMIGRLGPAGEAAISTRAIGRLADPPERGGNQDVREL